MECATNVNDLCLHNNAGLGDKLGNAGVPATTSTTKPVGIDGETPCGVAQDMLPFCDEDDEDEVFFGQVSNREQHKAQKFTDRRTALFVQGFRSDRRLMRYTIDKRRSECEIGSEERITSEYEHGSTCSSLSSISEEINDPALVSETNAGTEPENNSSVTVAKVANENGHLENKALATGNSEVCGSDRHVDACNLLHFFASVCALEPHQDSCETKVKDEMMVLEKATRDSERDKSGDMMTGSDTSSTDNEDTSVNNTSYAYENTDDSRDDEEEDNDFDSDDSCVVIINTGCGDETESESCDTEADTSELDVHRRVSYVGDIDTSDTKVNILSVGSTESRLCKNESKIDVGMESESLHGKTKSHTIALENEVNQSGVGLEMSESACIHGSFKCDADEEILFGPVRLDIDSEKRLKSRGGCIWETREMGHVVNSITCEISQMELNTECIETDGSGTEVVSDTRLETNGHGSVTNNSYQQSTAERFISERSNGASFHDSHEQSNNGNTPVVPLQRIHNTFCSAFQMYRKQDAVKSDEESHGVFAEGVGENNTNGSKEISVKLDFDNVATEKGYTGASSVSRAAGGFGTLFTCVNPTVARSEFGASSSNTAVVVATPTFIPPTPHTTSILGEHSVHGCYEDSVMSNFSLSQETSNHSLPSFASPAVAPVGDGEESHDSCANLHKAEGNNLTKTTAYRCQPTATRPMPSQPFTQTKVVAMVTPTVSRNIGVASPSVVFTERHFSPTPVSSRQFREEMPFGGNVRPAVSDYEGEDDVPPMHVSHSVTSPSLVFTEKHYSPTSMSMADSGDDRRDHGDTVDAVRKPDSTSGDSPQIVFKVHNFSPVVIQNDAPQRRVPACEKTCGSTKCEHCATVVRVNIATSPRVTGKGRPVQRLNRLKLKKINSIRKPALSPCKKTPSRSQQGGSTTAPNRCKQHLRPSPLVSQTGTRIKPGTRTPTRPGTPMSDTRSHLRQLKEGNMSTPSSQPPVHRQDTPRYKIGLLGSKVTRLPSPWGQRTPSSVGRQQPQNKTVGDSSEVSEERRSQLKQSHRDRTQSPGTPSAPRGLRAAFSPGVPKLLRMYDTPLTPTLTSADHLPRVRYKEKGLNQVQLDAITQLHTLCNSQQAVRYITRPRVGGAVKRVAGKACSCLSWQEDQLSHVPEDKHVPPPLEDSPTPKSILHVKPLTQLYPYSEDPLSPVVIHKTVRKTNTLAQAANKG